MTDEPQVPGQPASPPDQYPQPPAGYPPWPPAYVEPVAPDGRPLAGPGRRLAARLIDSVVYLLATAAVAAVVVGGLAAVSKAVTGEYSLLVPAVVISLVVLIVLGGQYLYEVELCLRWNGQTPGKRRMGIAVAAMEPGVALSRGRLANRFGLLFAFNLLSNCYVGLLDPLWCLWDKPYRQCLHDKPARTVVIRVDAG